MNNKPNLFAAAHTLNELNQQFNQIADEIHTNPTNNTNTRMQRAITDYETRRTQLQHQLTPTH